MRQVGGRDTGPVVAHGQLAAGQAYLHARRAELGRVVQQVADGGLEPPGVAEDDTRLEIGREADLRPVPPGAFQAGGDHIVEPDVSELAGGGLAPGQFGDVGDQLTELGDLGYDPV